MSYLPTGSHASRFGATLATREIALVVCTGGASVALMVL